jgi:hypothetical protein
MCEECGEEDGHKPNCIILRKEKIRASHNMEQGATLLASHYPPLWRALFLNLQKEEFTELQAMELLKAYIHATNGLRTN